MGLRPGQRLIAEVKTRSPFGWESERSWDEQFNVADKYGDMVSVHTDERWGGSFDLLAEARRRTNKQLLAKGIHESDEEIEQALENGADKVLVVGRIPGVYVDQCWLEPNNLTQLQGWKSKLEIGRGSQIVWNSRDLNNGGDNLVPFEQARAIWPGFLCQASNLVTVEDVHPTANAVLVGARLMQFVESLDQR